MGGLRGNSDGFPEFFGALFDGGVRDVAYLQKIGFLVFGLGIVPPLLSTTIALRAERSCGM